MSEAAEPSRGAAAAAEWRAVDPRAATELIDARLQTHHAAQLVAAIGISYLPHLADDSHTNLEWIDEVAALASRPVATPNGSFRLAVRPHVLALLVLDDGGGVTATFNLNGRTLAGAARWVRAQLEASGLDAGAYTLDKHYTIPNHAVATGTAFNATAPERFEQLSFWMANGATVLGNVARHMPHASEVRCWPHHFDLATLIALAPPTRGAPPVTIGVGLEPGDQYYREPYFYVNRSPAPDVPTPQPPLGGGGRWHTSEWVGAVLPGSWLVPSGGGQRSQAEEFTGSAIRACMKL